MKRHAMNKIEDLWNLWESNKETASAMASSKYKYEWKPRRLSGGMRTIHDPVLLEQRLSFLEETHRDIINEWAQFDSIAQRLEEFEAMTPEEKKAVFTEHIDREGLPSTTTFEQYTEENHYHAGAQRAIADGLQRRMQIIEVEKGRTLGLIDTLYIFLFGDQPGVEHKLRIHLRVKHFVDGLVQKHSSMTKGEAMWSATEAFGKSIEAIRGAYYYQQRTVVKKVR